MQARQSQNVAQPGPTTVEPFRIHGSTYPALTLRPEGPADEAFFAALDAEVSAYSAYFDNTPLVLDLEKVQDAIDVVQLRNMLDQLKRRRVSLIGLRHGNRAHNAVAKAAGLVALRASKDDEINEAFETAVPTVSEPAKSAEPEPEQSAPVAPVAGLTITEPVRSGQKVFAEHGDLVVVAPVSAGAELVAVGNIHVYGALRGRALAGVTGDTNARIFCQSFAAELVAVAGLYQTSEGVDASVLRKPAQVFLQDDTLRVCALT